MIFFPTLPSVNENSERESNPIPWSLYLYLSRSSFLISCPGSNKQLPNVKSVFKSLGHWFSMFEIFAYL